MSNPRVNLYHLTEKVEARSPVITGYIFRSSWEHRPIGLRFATERHGGISQFVSYEELATLLTREDLDRLDAVMRRQNRHSGVESLNDINNNGLNRSNYVELD